MYQRAFFSSLALIALAASATYWFDIRLRSSDISSFHQLVQESTELRARQALEEQPAHQKRQGVQKDIWSHDETRHFQIQSESSELILSQKKDKVEAIEELHNIRCATENGTLTADEGIYTYPSHQFTARNNCRLAQHDNYINGTRIQFDLAQEIITYDNPRGYIAPFHFTSHKLIWHKKEGKLYLTEQVTIEQPDHTTIFSDKGDLTLDDLEPLLLVLEGNVRLISTRIHDIPKQPEESVSVGVGQPPLFAPPASINFPSLSASAPASLDENRGASLTDSRFFKSFRYKESYAVADTLTYHPIDKTIRLSADRKVLFWQEGLSLSASEVLIRPDETIEGHGDVHFAFDLEEQNYIDTFFKQYL